MSTKKTHTKSYSNNVRLLFLLNLNEDIAESGMPQTMSSRLCLPRFSLPTALAR